MEKEKETEKKKKKQGEKEVLQFYIYKLPIDRPAAVTGNTKRLGAGPGVAGNVAESRESGGRLQSRFGGPEAKSGRWKTLDLSATLINSWPSSVEGFFPCLAYPLGGLLLGAPRLSYR